MLRTPAPATAGSLAEQLGLATPEFQDVELAPVVFRRARAKITAGKPTQREMLVSATAVEALVGSLGFASASAMFAAAFGVLVDEALLVIASLSEIEAGGAVCGYRLVLREAVKLEV
ncbi:hypothetical protein [Edaphobacter bradus]|uniref:hypothetical protein n=1 Tax=Edaphobacter bradus TaxID=2259016 RepID=UPI0021DFFF7B|nr:hypothetical protein [Edaphobacter bradus]